MQAKSFGLRAVMGMALAGCAIGAVAQDGDLDAQVKAIVAAHQGKVAVYARQLNTGKELAIDADTPVQTASVIKLAILYEAMIEVREGRAKLDETITMPKGYAVGGSGILQFFDAPMTLTLKDVLTFMVIESDNTATDLAIDRFTVKAVDDRMAQLGLANTYLYKRVMKPAVGTLPADYAKFGLGKTTAREMAELMTDIGECKLHPGAKRGEFAPVDDGDRAVCKVFLTMLTKQLGRNTIPRYLDPIGGEGAIASKTGSLNQVRNDVALVAGKSGVMVLSIFTWDNKSTLWTIDNEGENTISKIARTIQQAWSPDGMDSKKMVPGLGLDGAAVGK